MKKILLTLLPCLMFVSCGTMQNIQHGGFKPVDNAKVKCTAYTHSESDHIKYKRKSAVGTTLQANKSAASDWSQYPLDTVLRIDGRTYVVDDYGSALVKSEGDIPVIDIYQPSKRAMRNYGAHVTSNIQIVKLGDFKKSLDILEKRRKFAHCRTMADRIKKYHKLYAYEY